MAKAPEQASAERKLRRVAVSKGIWSLSLWGDNASYVAARWQSCVRCHQQGVALGPISRQIADMIDASFLPALPLSDLPPGAKLALELHGQPVLLCNVDGIVRAISNLCSHAEEPLACGRILFGWIACPAHGARFDLQTGEALNPPATAPIRIYPTRISGDMIEVAV